MDNDALKFEISVYTNNQVNILKDLKEFFVLLEGYFKKQDNLLQKYIEQRINGLKENQKELIIDDFGWDLHLNQFHFPNLHRQSVLLTVYSHFEYSLTHLCLLFRELHEVPLNLKDLSGAGIKKAKTYLEKIIGISFKSCNKEWEYIQKINLLRNSVVHNGGILPPEENSKLNMFVKDNKNLSGKPGEQIIFSKEFLLEIVDHLCSFFTNLGEEVIKRIDT